MKYYIVQEINLKEDSIKSHSFYKLSSAKNFIWEKYWNSECNYHRYKIKADRKHCNCNEFEIYKIEEKRVK